MRVFIADSLDRGLETCGKESYVNSYSFLPSKAPELVKAVEAELAKRYETLMNGNSRIDTEKLLVLVLCGQANIESVCLDSSALSAYKNILGKYKAMGVCVLISECENTAINFNSPEIMKKLKEEQKMLFFDELGNLKMFDLPFAILKKFKKPLLPDDAFFIHGNECLRIKTPHKE